MDDLPELRGGSLIARSRRHEGHEKSITGSTEVIDRSISRPHIKRNALQWDEHLDDDEFSAGSNDRFIAGATLLVVLFPHHIGRCPVRQTFPRSSPAVLSSDKAGRMRRLIVSGSRLAP